MCVVAMFRSFFYIYKRHLVVSRGNLYLVYGNGYSRIQSDCILISKNWVMNLDNKIKIMVSCWWRQVNNVNAFKEVEMQWIGIDWGMMVLILKWGVQNSPGTAIKKMREKKCGNYLLEGISRRKCGEDTSARRRL